MNIIVVASQKGGAGKTTLLRSLAVAMQQYLPGRKKKKRDRGTGAG